MAPVSDGIGGFFTRSGELIDPRQPAAADPARSKQDRQSTQQGAVIAESAIASDAPTLSSALGRVSQRTRAQVDEAIAANDRSQADLQRAQTIVGQQREKLDQIRQAEKDGADEQTLSALKHDYKELEQERNALVAELKVTNREREQAGAQFVRVGQQEVARIQPRAVNFESSSADLDSKEGLKAAREALNDDVTLLRDQRKGLREDRKEIKAAFREAKNLLSAAGRKEGNEESAVRAIEEAVSLAATTSASILKAGSAALVNNLSSSNVSRLLS